MQVFKLGVLLIFLLCFCGDGYGGVLDKGDGRLVDHFVFVKFGNNKACPVNGKLVSCGYALECQYLSW